MLYQVNFSILVKTQGKNIYISRLECHKEDINETRRKNTTGFGNFQS